MDLRKLRYFVGLAEAGGFRRASDALGVAQPALTRQIRSLETDLGVQLVARSKAGVTLLPAREALLEEARDILVRVDRLADLVVARHRSEAVGEVRIGLPSALADTMLGPLVETVRAGYPVIQIVCREGAVDAAIQVEEGNLDLAIVSAPVGHGRYDCHAEVLLKEQDYMVSTDAGRHDQISLSDLFARPLMLTPLPNARRRHLETLAARQGARLDVVAEAATMTAQRDLVARGLAAAVLPLSAARLMRRDGFWISPIENLWSYRLLLRSRSARRPLATDLVAQALRTLVTAGGHRRA